MGSYDLTIAKAKAFNGDLYSDVLTDIASFASQTVGRVILGVNFESNPEDNTITAYVMYEG